MKKVFLAVLVISLGVSVFSVALAKEEAEAKDRKIVVKVGDTMWSLCRTHLGYGEVAWFVAQYNHICPDSIKPGQVIKLPKMRRIGWMDPRTGEKGHFTWTYLSIDDLWYIMSIEVGRHAWCFHIDETAD
jgi:hypothetical protein